MKQTYEPIKLSTDQYHTQKVCSVLMVLSDASGATRQAHKLYRSLDADHKIIFIDDIGSVIDTTLKWIINRDINPPASHINSVFSQSEGSLLGYIGDMSSAFNVSARNAGLLWCQNHHEHFLPTVRSHIPYSNIFLNSDLYNSKEFHNIFTAIFALYESQRAIHFNNYIANQIKAHITKHKDQLCSLDELEDIKVDVIPNNPEINKIVRRYFINSGEQHCSIRKFEFVASCFVNEFWWLAGIHTTLNTAHKRLPIGKSHPISFRFVTELGNSNRASLLSSYFGSVKLFYDLSMDNYLPIDDNHYAASYIDTEQTDDELSNNGLVM